MKKRALLMLAVFLFLIPLVFAEYSEVIFEDWVYNNGNFTADNKTFFSTVSAKSPVAGIAHDNETVLVRLSECGTLQNKLNICFKERELWYEDRLDRNYYKAKIEISKYMAKLEIKRYFDNPDLYIGEETNVRLSIKNTGSLDAKDIEFMDEIPLNFTITDFSSCILSGNTLKWRGNLTPEQEVECSYRIKAMAAGKYVSQPSVKYYNGHETVTEEAESVDFHIPGYALNLSFNITNSSEIGKDFNVFFSITNNDKEKDLSIGRLTINSGDWCSILARNYELKQTGNQIFYSGGIPKGSTKTFFIKIKPKITGRYNFTGDATFELDGILNQIEFSSHPVDVYSIPLSIMSYKPSVVKSGASFAINVSVKNPSNYAFSNLEVRVESDMPGFENRSFELINKFDSKEFRHLMYQEVTAPSVSRDTVYKLYVYATYMTPYSERLHVKDVGKIEVKAPFSEKTETAGKIEEEGADKEKTEKETTEVKEAVVKLKEEAKGVFEKKDLSSQEKLFIVVLITLFVIADVFLVKSIVKKLRTKSKEE